MIRGEQVAGPVGRILRTLAALGPVYFGLVLVLGGAMFLYPSWEFVLGLVRGRMAHDSLWIPYLLGSILWTWGLALMGVGVYDAAQVWRGGGNR